MCFGKMLYLCGKNKRAFDNLPATSNNYRTMERNNYWQKLRKIVINKYAVALYLFLLLLIFVGDHSLVQYIKRAKKIRAIEQQLILTNEDIQRSQSVMQVLDNMDSLERFAREEYRMHAPNEDVYIVEP